MRLSPAEVLLEAAIGFKPKQPERVDVDYARMLAKSYEKVEELEAWNDLMLAIDKTIEKIRTAWEDGKAGANELRVAVWALKQIRKTPDFAKRQFEDAEKRERTLASWRRERAPQQKV